MTARCEHCVTFSGTHIKGRECCDVRLLADMPPPMVKGAFEKVRREKGDDAAAALRERVRAEYTRIRDHRKQGRT